MMFSNENNEDIFGDNSLAPPDQGDIFGDNSINQIGQKEEGQPSLGREEDLFLLSSDGDVLDAGSYNQPSGVIKNLESETIDRNNLAFLERLESMYREYDSPKNWSVSLPGKVVDGLWFGLPEDRLEKPIDISSYLEKKGFNKPQAVVSDDEAIILSQLKTEGDEDLAFLNISSGIGILAADKDGQLLRDENNDIVGLQTSHFVFDPKGEGCDSCNQKGCISTAAGFEYLRKKFPNYHSAKQFFESEDPIVKAAYESAKLAIISVTIESIKEIEKNRKPITQLKIGGRGADDWGYDFYQELKEAIDANFGSNKIKIEWAPGGAMLSLAGIIGATKAHQAIALGLDSPTAIALDDPGGTASDLKPLASSPFMVPGASESNSPESFDNPFASDQAGSTGPSSAGPGSAGPGSAGPGSTGHSSAGPGSAGPGSAGPGAAGSGSAGPGSAGPGSAGPGSSGPGAAGPGSAGPGSAGPGAAGPGAAGPGAAGPSNNKPVISSDPLSGGVGAEAANQRIQNAKDNPSKTSSIKDSAKKIAKTTIKNLIGAKAAAKKLIVALAPYWPVLALAIFILFFSVIFLSTALGLGKDAFDKLVNQKGAYDSLGFDKEIEKIAEKSGLKEAAAVQFDCNSLAPADRRPAPAKGANCVEGLLSSWQQANQGYFSPIPKSASWLIPAYKGAGRYYRLPWQLFGAINGARSNFGNPNCIETSGGVGFMRTGLGAWREFAVDAGSSKLTESSTSGACKKAEGPMQIGKNYNKSPKGNPVSRPAQKNANFFEPVDAIYTEGNQLAALGARFQNEKEWDYTGSSANSCTVPKRDGKILYPPSPAFDLSGGFSGIQGNGKTLRLSSKLIKLGKFYKKKWGEPSAEYKGAIPKKVLVQMLTEIWLAFGVNPRQAKINAQANYKQVRSESSGRPYATQGMCDVNGCPGDPNIAGGLLQFIPGTFNTWKVAGFNDRFNAVDNLLAGVNAQVNSDSLWVTGTLDGKGYRKVKVLAGQGGWGPSGGGNPYKSKKKVVLTDGATAASAKPFPYKGKPQTDKISKALLKQGYSPCYVAVIHDWYKLIVKYPPQEDLSAGLLPGGVKRVTSPKKLVKCPKNIPQDTGNACYIDARLLSNMVYLSKTFQIYITDAYSGPLPGGGAAGCYASGSQCHSLNGEHPIGAAIDGTPSKGSWAPIDKLAKIVEPVQNDPKPPFKWVGYNGDSNHGRGDHIHLSWTHGGAPPYKLPPWVLVFGSGSAPGGKGKQFNKKFSGKYDLGGNSGGNTMKTATNITAKFEGWFPCPYNDPVGYATIGYGHLIGLRPVTAADKRKWGCLSKKQGKRLLAKDLKKYNRYVSQYINVPLTSNMRAALISFTMNVGGGALKGSTLRKKLNKKNYLGAAKEFKAWNKGGGVVLPGLVRRREEERKLFLKGSGKLIK